MMRRLVLVLLVACGGKTPPPADPIQNVAPAKAEPRSSPPRFESGGGVDRDGDGVYADSDRCPDDPEDYDGFMDEDGCHDPDNDLDGILDVDDLCPNEPETRNGTQDDDGCPD